MGFMVVRGETTRRVSLEEIAVLVIENPAVSLTGCLIEALIEKKVKIIFCDSKRNPAAELEKKAVSEDFYGRTIELVSEIENHLMNISFDFLCDINYNKLDIGSIIRASGVEINDSYTSLGEKIIDYIELVTEFDRRKLFLTVNLRSYISDNEASEFMKTILSHGYNVIMLESSEHSRLDCESRYIIDADLCEIFV